MNDNVVTIDPSTLEFKLKSFSKMTQSSGGVIIIENAEFAVNDNRVAVCDCFFIHRDSLSAAQKKGS